MNKFVFKQKYILVILIFILLFSIQNESFAFKRAKENDPALEISLEDMEGNKIKLSDYKGSKIVALVFWKHPSLRGEKALLLFQKLYDTYNKEFPFQVLSIYVPQNDDQVTQDEIASIKSIISNNNITFPNLIDKGMEVFNRWGVITFPSIALVDKEGIFIYELPGLPEFFGEKDIIKNVKKALGIKEKEAPVVAKVYQSKNNANYYLNLAKLVNAKGNTAKAIQHTLLALERDPDYADAYSYLGFLYSQVKENKKAVDAYLKALKLDSNNSDTLLAYGFLCMESDMHEDAFLQFRNIIQSNPDKAAEGHFGLGVIYLKDGIYDSARVHQEEAVKLYQTWKKFTVEEQRHFALAYYNLAETYLKLQQKDKSIQNLQESFKIYKNFVTDLLRGKESMLDYSRN